MRRRILIAIVGVAAVAVLVFAVPLGVTVRDLTIDDELSELERAAERTGRSIEPERVNPVGTRHVAVTSREFHLGVYDRNGHRVRGRGPLRLEADLRDSLRGTVSRHVGGPFRVAVPIGIHPVRGAVRATAHAAAADDRVVRAWLILAGFALLAVAAAGALAWWLSGRLDAPLTRLARAARRVGDGDFTSRAPRSGISEIDGVADAIDATARRLGDAIDRERAFSADVSHQLRTRVAGLRITLESALLAGTADQGVIEESLEETDRLAAIIDELLALARDTHGDRAPLHIRTVLDELEAGWRGRLAADGRRLRVQLEHDLPEVRASEAATRQILDVLLDNATRHGSGEIRVVARSAPEGVAIDVSDDGPGIAVDADAVFARRAAVGDGHGIGLALARALAEAEGGRLLLTSRTPGARFTLLLPVARKG